MIRGDTDMKNHIKNNTKKLILFLILTLTITLVFPQGLFADGPIRDRYIIIFEHQIDREYMNSLGIKTVHAFDNVPMVVVEASYWQIQKIAQLSSVELIENDQIVQVDFTNDMQFPVIEVDPNGQMANWGIDRLGIKAAWTKDIRGNGVKVAVIDTGIANHRDLTIAGGRSFIPNNASFRDDHGHGTHVAGIIAGQNTKAQGVAPGVELYAIKVLDSRGKGEMSNILAGVDWAISNNMDIVNLSLGTVDRSSALERLFEKGLQAGMLFVAAAGNDGDSKANTMSYPARSEHVIAVGSTSIFDERSVFSSIGQELEIVAPGEQIISTYTGNRYVRTSGTSMAAPHVSGLLALFKEAYPNLSNSEIRQELIRHTVDLGTPGKDDYFGFGLAQGPFAIHLPFKNADINGHWAYSSLRDFVTAELVKGYNVNGVYSVRPENTINRAEFTAILVRALGLDKTLSVHGESNLTIDHFEDITGNDWFFPYIRIAYQNGIIGGTTDSTFEPNRPITRAEIATMIVRAFANTVHFDGQQRVFNDIDNHWGRTHIIDASRVSIITGYPDGTFRPDYRATRAEAIVMLDRALLRELPDEQGLLLLELIRDYEQGRFNRFQTLQTNRLGALNDQHTIGYYKTFINQYDYGMAYWNHIARVVARNPVDAGIVVEKFHVQKMGKRTAKVQIDIAWQVRYTTFGSNVIYQYIRQGTYSLKKLPDGSWKIHDYIPAMM